jgi:NOL1/NOP2/fmu family ribosome biogenesis protein
LENRENVEWLLQHFDLEQVKLTINPDWVIVEKPFGYQFYPHLVRGEGFFLSIFKKREKNTEGVIANHPLSKIAQNTKLNFEKLPKKQIENVSKWLQKPTKFDFFIKPNGIVFIILKKQIEPYLLIDKVLKRKSVGLEIGEFKGQDFIPSHDLALSIEVAETTPSVNLSKNEALRFLKKETFDMDYDAAPRGWALVRYEGLALGWVKILPNRINNYLPKDYRIRMDLPS